MKKNAAISNVSLLDKSSETGDANEKRLKKFKPVTVGKDFLTQITYLKRRPYIIENRLLRGYVSAIFSPGGVGKSVFELTKAISIAAGNDLLGLGLVERANVLVINNEDDEDELKRRIAAIMQHYDVDPDELEGRFYYYSGYGNPMVVAKREGNSIVTAPHVDKLRDFVFNNDIGAVFIDPFISTHDASENDNNNIDKVVTEYKTIASDVNIGVSLVHHTRKIDGSSTESHAGDPEAGRGASSLKDAARVIETLARMSPKTADKLGLDFDMAKRFIRLDNGKLNFGVMDADPLWFYMESVEISNGDSVGVPVRRNLDPLFSSASNKGVKWDAMTAAEALERIMGNMTSVKWLDIRQQFMDDNDVRKSQADNIRSKLSDNKSEPTAIKVNGQVINYWTEKAHAKAPVYICRQVALEQDEALNTDS